MIKDNIIYFGYGDISVSNTLGGYLILRWFKPPVKIGTIMTPDIENELIYLSEEIRLNIIINDLNNISKIDNNSVNKQIIVDGYILDFTNYNSLSVQIVKRHMNNALSNMLMLLACLISEPSMSLIMILNKGEY